MDILDEWGERGGRLGRGRREKEWGRKREGTERKCKKAKVK